MAPDFQSYLLNPFLDQRRMKEILGDPRFISEFLVWGFTLSYRPFYGYHAKEKTFLKIYLYNPQMVKR